MLDTNIYQVSIIQDRDLNASTVNPLAFLYTEFCKALIRFTSHVIGKERNFLVIMVNRRRTNNDLQDE